MSVRPPTFTKAFGRLAPSRSPLPAAGITPAESADVMRVPLIHDLAGAQAMMASPSPETAAAMERHGVLPPLTLYIEK